MSLSPSARRGLVVLGAIGLLLAVSIGVPHRVRPPFDPFSAVPRTSTALAHLDVAALAQSSLELDLARLEPSLPAAHSLARLCRVDPLRSLQQIVVFVPKPRKGSDSSELGLAAVGSIDADSVIDCAERVLQARGLAPVRATLDSFRSVRAQDGSGVEVAVRDGGPLLVASGPALRDMIDATEGRSPNIIGTDLHRQTLSRMGAHPIVASVVLDPHWVESAGAPATARSPLSEIRSASFAVDPASLVRLAAELRCTSPASAVAVADTLAALGRSLAPTVRAQYGISSDDASVEARGAEVRVTLALSPDSAARLIGVLLAGDVPMRPPDGGAWPP
jgi:hypothetical protein